jgi:hypothetical protein
MRRTKVVLTSLALVGAAGGVHAYVQDQAVKRAELQASKLLIVEQLASAIETYFLYPEIGRKYATALRANLATGKYSKSQEPREFADAVTAHLQEIYPDGHLRLMAPRRSSIIGAALSAASAKGSSERPDTGIEHAMWLTPGVAYIAFELFPGTEASLAALRRELERIGSAKTLIIDARTHGGGYTEEIDLLSSFLFDKVTPLAIMETRAAADRGMADSATLKQMKAVDGLVRRAHFAVPSGLPTPLRKAKVFLLTSGYTGSAAEHLALALKRTGRATLIGETTGGAGHYGKIVDLPAGFTAFIPVGRTFDPDTGEGWEGVGVDPHIKAPAGEALQEALVRSSVAPATAAKIAASIKLRGTMKRQVPLRRPPPRV